MTMTCIAAAAAQGWFVMTYRTRRRLRHKGNCPACGAIPSNWLKVPKMTIVDLATISTEELVPADCADNYDPRDIFRCPRCGFMGHVSEHPETSDGYIDWDDWEYSPKYCPNCGLMMVRD